MINLISTRKGVVRYLQIVVAPTLWSRPGSTLKNETYADFFVGVRSLFFLLTSQYYNGENGYDSRIIGRIDRKFARGVEIVYIRRRSCRGRFLFG